MTEEQLKVHKWKLFSWNNGAILEYWKPLRGKNNFDFRLSVRFGEYPEPKRPFAVYLTANTQMIWLRHIQTITELEALYALLREE